MTLEVWGLWAVGVAALGWRFTAIRRDVSELISPVTILTAGFFWMYVIGYWTLDPMTSERYLSKAGYTKVLVLAILTVAAFWCGARSSKPPTRRGRETPQNLASALGAALIVLGGVVWMYFVSLSGGFSEYYSAIHGSAGVWTQTTAYIYCAVYLLFSGCAVLAWVQAQGRLGLPGLALLGGAVGYLIFDAWMTGSRGYVLRLGLLFCVYLLFWRRPQVARTGRSGRSQMLVVTILVLLPVLFVVLPLFRSASHLGAEHSLVDALVAVVETATLRKEAGPGHEVVFAAGLVQAAWEQNAIDYGYLWLHPLVNVVPRIWWPEKPYVAEFSFDEFLLIGSNFGWMPTDGAAPTGLADAFVRFSWLSPLVWVLFGWMGARLFQRARLRRDLKSVSYFFCYLVGLSYMVTQGFTAAVYATLFMALPLSVSFAVGKRLSYVVLRTR
jgi:hypothetical protein